MKKPGPPAAGRVVSGCVMRFREGNGSCVHRHGLPGGGPFCVARCRVCFDHSLSQVSLLRRNLITVFLCVNKSGDFFFVPGKVRARRRVWRSTPDAPSVRRSARAREKRFVKKRLVSCCLQNAARSAGHDDAHVRHRSANPERKPNGAHSPCMRRAKKRGGYRVAQGRLRGKCANPRSTRPSRGSARSAMFHSAVSLKG